jgi:RNA polymerase sigma-B factor
MSSIHLGDDAAGSNVGVDRQWAVRFRPATRGLDDVIGVRRSGPASSTGYREPCGGGMSGAHDVHHAGDRSLDDLDVAALAYAEALRSAPVERRGELRDRLVCRCLPFAGRLARRYGGRGESSEDLEQVARLGLVKAIDRYDPERGSFTAYAVITISGEIKRHFRDKTWGVHVPRRLQDLSLEVGHATVVLTTRLSRPPTTSELATHLHVDEDDVTEALGSAAGYTPASLNAPVGAGRPGELGDLFGGVDLDLESVDDRLTVSRLLLRLPARERQILAMRFYGNCTQTEIAAEFGISQMHVSRLLSRALTWLREAMLSDEPARWEGVGAAPRALQVTVVAGRHGVAVRVRGEVDRDSVGKLRSRLRHAVATGTPVAVDLSAMPLIDAAGVAALADAAAAADRAGSRVTLVGAQTYVARILVVSGLGPLLCRAAES